MGTVGIVLLVSGAIAIARGIDWVGSRWTSDRSTTPTLAISSAGALLGGLIASEFLGRLGEWGYEIDGLYVFPAAIGATIVGLAVWLVIRVTANRVSQHI